MRRWRPLLMAALAVAFIGEFASADLVGLRVFREDPGGLGPAPPGPERWIYRVYAEFTTPNEAVFGWGVYNGFGPGSISNILLDGSPGSGFTNIPDDVSGNVAPFAPGTARDWDTYMTIGVLYGQEAPGGIDLTLTGPFGSLPFISNGSTSWDDGFAGLTQGDGPQGFGNYRVVGNDTDTRVLLMQLVVNAGENVRGTIGVAWRIPGVGAFLTEGLTFNSVPGPSALAVTLLALLFSSRRGRFDQLHVTP